METEKAKHRSVQPSLTSPWMAPCIRAWLPAFPRRATGQADSACRVSFLNHLHRPPRFCLGCCYSAWKPKARILACPFEGVASRFERTLFVDEYFLASTINRTSGV